MQALSWRVVAIGSTTNRRGHLGVFFKAKPPSLHLQAPWAYIMADGVAIAILNWQPEARQQSTLRLTTPATRAGPLAAPIVPTATTTEVRAPAT